VPERQLSRYHERLLPIRSTWIGLAGAAHQAWSANLYSTASDMFPKNAVASLIGIGSAAGSVGGMIFPIVTGVLLDKFQASGNVTRL